MKQPGENWATSSVVWGSRVEQREEEPVGGGHGSPEFGGGRSARVGAGAVTKGVNPFGVVVDVRAVRVADGRQLDSGIEEPVVEGVPNVRTVGEARRYRRVGGRRLEKGPKTFEREQSVAKLQRVRLHL